MKGIPTDFGTATVASVNAVRQVWNSGQRTRVIADERWSGVKDKEDATLASEIFIAIPMKLPSVTNLREYWTKKHQRNCEQREIVESELLAHAMKREVLATGCVMTLTRIAPRKLDSDNLPGAFKAIRDVVAAWLLGGRLGQRDSDPRLEWHYSQASLGSGIYGVTIGIRKREETR